MRRKRRKRPKQKRSRARRGRSLKRLAIEARVAQRRVVGESEREIARNEGLSPSAVHRILSREEFRTIQAEGRSAAVRLVHKAVQVVDHHLDKKDLTAGLETLKGTQVLVSRAQTDVALSQPAEYTEWGYAAYANRSNEELEFAVKFHHWPSEQEIAVKKDTGYWPQELLDKKDQQ